MLRFVSWTFSTDRCRTCRRQGCLICHEDSGATDLAHDVQKPYALGPGRSRDKPAAVRRLRLRCQKALIVREPDCPWLPDRDILAGSGLFNWWPSPSAPDGRQEGGRREVSSSVPYQVCDCSILGMH